MGDQRVNLCRTAETKSVKLSIETRSLMADTLASPCPSPTKKKREIQPAEEHRDSDHRPEFMPGRSPDERQQNRRDGGEAQGHEEQWRKRRQADFDDDELHAPKQRYEHGASDLGWGHGSSFRDQLVYI